ncbi:hypothetical protein NKJ06_23035 [Mesorhizobium sp. M0293]|uniref:hypothetical protein n=1 Tax=unclassified Mesorhizobium TaxID=325217 RepID=UPI00333722DC
MRGAVLHYDKDQDYGYINGVDGKRYFFARNDLNQGQPSSAAPSSNSNRMTARHTISSP